jgi:hypothetical protein
MLNLTSANEPWAEMDVLKAHINLYGFWNDANHLCLAKMPSARKMSLIRGDKCGGCPMSRF